MTNRILPIACLAVLVAVACGAFAQTRVFTAVRLAPNDLQWMQRANGSSGAVVAGDDTMSGMYAYRVRFPANFRVQPHFHPDDRAVVVISGTLHFGFGEQFDEGAMKALPPASTWTEPAGQPHYAWAKDGEVVIQVVGTGPSGTTPVSPTQ